MASNEKAKSILNGKHGEKSSPSSVSKPIFNKDGKIVFSKFDFSNGVGKSKQPKTDLPTGKNYKQLLEKVKKQKDKMEKIQDVDSAKAKELKEKAKWKSAISKAEGIKIKNNPDLLMKAMKRKEKMKEKNKKNWDKREDKLDQKMKERQDKRAKNIQKKKQGKRDGKITKAKKRGRVIPGF